MDQDRRHIQATDRPDAAHGAGRQGVDAGADGAFGVPDQVVLFDPATDTSPYAAQHVKPKKRSRAPGEKPAARRSASAAVPSDPTGAWSAYPAGGSPRTVGRPAARPTAGRGAAAQGPGARNPRAAAQTTSSWLRIVTDDPGEIARYAQEQHGREATAGDGARRAAGRPAAHDARGPRPGDNPQVGDRPRTEHPGTGAAGDGARTAPRGDAPQAGARAWAERPGSRPQSSSATGRTGFSAADAPTAAPEARAGFPAAGRAAGVPAGPRGAAGGAPAGFSGARPHGGPRPDIDPRGAAGTRTTTGPQFVVNGARPAGDARPEADPRPGDEPLPPEPAAWSTYDIDDDPDHPRPAARRRAPKAAAATPDEVLDHARTLRRELDSETVWRRALVAVTAAAAVFITVTMLYFPAQRLYLAARENERLTDELEQNLARNEQMRDRVASLQTAEGIQDEARRSYNLVMPGESAVAVVGADYTPPSNAIPAEIPRGSGENTTTWATDLLDHVFGVTGAGSSTAVGTDVATVTDQPAAPADAGADIVAQGDEAPAQP